MEAVIAGWVAGYVMAMASTAALVFLLVRARASRTVTRWLSPEVPGALLAVPVFLGTVVAWTMAGLVLGSIYRVGELAAEPDLLGSPSAPFLLGVVALAWLPLPPLVLFARRFWWLWCVMSALFVGLFGWVMPLLAGD